MRTSGVLTPVFALVNLVSMIGAIVLVHLPNGLFVTENGYELVLSIAAALVVVAALGAGRRRARARAGRLTPATPQTPVPGATHEVAPGTVVCRGA